MSIARLELIRPDDWHVHLRDGDAMAAVLPDTARRFARAVVMPNLKPPVATTAQADAYRQRILAALPAGTAFEPLMTLYLSPDTSPQEIVHAHASGGVFGVKYYPAGATTNSEAGLSGTTAAYPVFEAMEKAGMPLLLHGEVTDPSVDIFDRERVFIERHLIPLRERFPALRIVLEHITTRDAVQYIEATPAHVGATITVHHLLLNRNAIFDGGIHPHLYCAPILKREVHRQALIAAATGGHPKFMLGTDSAPHTRAAKENACGCAGIYTAHAGIELYAEVFEQAGALDRLEAFTSFHGADFHHLPRNRSRIVLERTAWTVPQEQSFGPAMGVPLRAGQQVSWTLRADAALS